MSGCNFKVTLIVLSNVNKFLSVNKSIPTNDDQKTSLDSSSCNHMATEEEENKEEMHFQYIQLAQMCPWLFQC